LSDHSIIPDQPDRSSRHLRSVIVYFICLRVSGLHVERRTPPHKLTDGRERTPISRYGEGME
jgi:hypothetical protein